MGTVRINTPSRRDTNTTRVASVHTSFSDRYTNTYTIHPIISHTRVRSHPMYKTMKMESENERRNSTSFRVSPMARTIPFINKLERLLLAQKHICWSEDGQNIVVQGIRTEQFTKELGEIGLSNKPESFIRQLNTYGFRKIQEPLDNTLVSRLNLTADQLSIYHNPHFTRHDKNLNEIHAIGKRKPVNNDREALAIAQKQILELQSENTQLANFIHIECVVNPLQTNAQQQIAATNLLLGLKYTRIDGGNVRVGVSNTINIPLNIMNVTAPQMVAGNQEEILKNMFIGQATPSIITSRPSPPTVTNSQQIQEKLLELQLLQARLANNTTLDFNGNK